MTLTYRTPYKAFTIWNIGGEALPSRLYVAVILCTPAGSVVVMIAVPSTSGTVPSVVAPFMKVTFPPGLVVTTDAVSAIACDGAAGFAEEDTRARFLPELNLKRKSKPLVAKGPSAIGNGPLNISLRLPTAKTLPLASTAIELRR